ncbi:MAG: sigma 54-interacting transcriptional regulator, partial [Thermodesulfovibrionales bacterium]|nr:sigma 54-interacting transcriptional regulator [Thermodesulfovibrionales bacterium]
TVDIAEGEKSMHMQVLDTGNPVRNVPLKVGPLKRDVIVHVAQGEIEGKVAGSVGVIHDISEIKRLTNELTEARGLLRRLRARYTWDDITGESPAIRSAKEQALRAAETPATVLLRGESGNGKELFAHAIHNASERHDEQFVSVNCAAIAGSLLESELFGYEEGAFTGALKGGKRGFFEEAHGGTIFLDEIGELSLATQSKLLRVLQEKEIVRVGGTEPMTVDVRVIAATNADLETMIKEGAFREDLYYRLNVVPIFLIPLRDRREDIPQLATQMLFRLNADYHRLVERVSPGAMDALMKHHWPGNVRELQNVLGQAMLNMRPQDKVIEAAHIPLNMGAAAAASAIQTPDRVRKLKEVVAGSEADAIRAALRKTKGNRTEAAKLLGVSLRSLYYKIERYNID